MTTMFNHFSSAWTLVRSFFFTMWHIERLNSYFTPKWISSLSGRQVDDGMLIGDLTWWSDPLGPMMMVGCERSSLRDSYPRSIQKELGLFLISSISFGTRMSTDSPKLLLISLLATRVWGTFPRACLENFCSLIQPKKTSVHQVEILCYL